MTTVETLPRKLEAWWALAYFGVYMAYHTAVGGESDAMHWLGLVLIPLAGLVVLQRAAAPGTTLTETLGSIGLRRDRARNALGIAIGLGLGISVLQSLGRFDELAEIVASGRVVYLFPLVLLLLLLTAGFTEEVFFRGIVQTRLREVTGSALAAVLVTSVLFSVYHLPYTYLNPNWSSAGDLSAAVRAAFVNGMLGGVLLGWLYERSEHNLVATIVLHSLINSIPALTLIRFSGG